jgi:hypothetical protein
MKRIPVLLASLLLIVLEGMPLFNAQAAVPAAACDACNCAKMKCCAQTAPESQPTPAVPQSGRSQRDSHLPPTLSGNFFCVRAALGPAPAVDASLAFPFTSVPIFRRTCRLLI